MSERPQNQIQVPSHSYSHSGENNNGNGNENENENGMGAKSNKTTLRRLSQWIWSGWTTTGPTVGTNNTTSNNGHNATREASTRVFNYSPSDGSATTSSNSSTRTDYEKFSCRTCRMRKVECDRLLPRCSHCLDEQLLCFYVEPIRISRKRAKDLRMQSSSFAQGQRQVPEVHVE